jgi:tRNA dimethylallyltransferase
MLDAGLIDEVRALRARGDLHPGLPAMRCVGYRQAWQALDAGLGATALREQVRAAGSAATRQLAKRQLTWLRGMAWRRVVACDSPAALDDAVAAIAVIEP